MKKLLVIGAGIGQVPIVKKAKEMGVHVTVVTMPGKQPCIELADDVIYSDIYEREYIVEEAKKRGITAVTSDQNDLMNPKINRWGVLIFAGLYFCVGVISLLLYPSYSLDVHLNYYYNYIICFLMIISGNFLLFCVSSRANVRLHILEFIGKHSLIFYIWSGYASFIFTKILTITGITENVNYQLIGLIETVGACIILSVAAVTLNWIKQKLTR